MINFLLLVNKQGQRRIVKYYQHVEQDQRNAIEVPIIRKALMRSDKEVKCEGLRLYLNLLYWHTNCTQSDLIPPHTHTHVFEFYFLQCSFFECNNYNVIFRRYATLYFIVGTDGDEVGPLVLLICCVDRCLKMLTNYWSLIRHRLRLRCIIFIFIFPGFQNELAIYEFLHNIVETFDRYFSKVVSDDYDISNTEFMNFVLHACLLTIHESTPLFNISGNQSW